MKMRITMEAEIKNVILVGLASIACLCYCHLISARLPKGKWRLISLVPIFCIFSILPLYTSTVFFTAGVAIQFTWLANFRLLLFAFNQGPLSSYNNLNLPIFIIMAALPYSIKPKKSSKKLEPSTGENRTIPKLGQLNSKGAPKGLHGIALNLESLYSCGLPQLSVAPPLKLMAQSLATKIPIFAMLVSVFLDDKDTHIPHLVLFLLYWCFSLLFIEIVCGLTSAMAYVLSGLDLDPPCNKPYLATSLQDFWGRRWNLIINNILRQTVYMPVQSAAAVVLGIDRAAAPVAMMTSFLVSGLAHELILWYIIRASPSWEVTIFFVFQGVCVVLEIGLKVTSEKKEWRLPCLVSRLLTVGFVVGTSFWLLWPPLIRSGIVVRVTEETRLVVEVAKECVMEIWERMRHKWYDDR